MVLKADKQLRTALALAEQPEDKFLELARSLAEMYEDDRASLGRFIEQSGIKSRKAYYLLDLGKRLPKLDISDHQLRGIGWTKLQIIVGKLTPRGSKKWLQLAERQSAQQLTAVVRGQSSNPKRRCVLLYFTPKEYSELESAVLNNGGKKRGRGLVNKEGSILKIIRKHNTNTKRPPENRR